MPDDLYHANLQSISGADLYQSILDFTRVNFPNGTRPREGFLLDFKTEMGDKFVRAIAALANTFGGLVILGVADDDHDGRPDSLPGVASTGELKTRVANVIGSNLIPCPMFEIAECALPTDPDKKLCAIRVRETQEICFITTKGEKNPVYVRVEDKSEPADASAQRALLERKRRLQNSGEELTARLDLLRKRVLFMKQDSAGGVFHGDFFRMLLCPLTHPRLSLDLVLEERFAKLVLNQALSSLVTNGDATVGLPRGRDWFEVRFQDPEFEHERRWHLTDNAELAFITTTKWPMPGKKSYWSLYDLAADFVATAKLAKQFWQGDQYYGAFHLEAELQLGKLELMERRDGFPSFYCDRLGYKTIMPMQRNILAIAQAPGHLANASAEFSYQDLNLRLDDIAADVLNQLLRSLGHGTEIEKLKAAVRLLIA